MTGEHGLDRLSTAGYCIHEYWGCWEACLAWNIGIAALLYLGAMRGPVT